MIVGGQSTTDDSQDCVPATENDQLFRTVAMLEAELAKWVATVKKLEARQISETANNRKLLFTTSWPY